MFAYKPHFIPSNIVLIGGGGTGSRLMPALAQLVRASIRRYNPLSWIENINLWVVDGDTVETKNLLRQNFIERDVGKNKAQVLADRYSTAYGIPITAVPKFMTPADNLEYTSATGQEEFYSAFYNSIIILAVDSAKVRRDILARVCGMYDGSHPITCGNQFWIDPGNEDDFGQVKYFTPHIFAEGEQTNVLCGLSLESRKSALLRGLPERIPVVVELPYLPMDIDYYSNLGDSVQEKSCAELPQTLAINSMMANLILATIQNFIQMKAIPYECQFYSLKGTMTTQGITAGLLANRTAPKISKTAMDGFSDTVFRSARKTRWYSSPGSGKDIPKMLNEFGPFAVLKAECETAYRQMGMMLDQDGKLIQIPQKVAVVEGKPPEAEEKAPKLSRRKKPVAEAAAPPLPTPLPAREVPELRPAAPVRPLDTF